ncbi:MAG: HNH endonuclease signature motif containing protein [Gulosibacter sp.]|uniref:HNH endonuclease signature motif containing protein n=1 Tax=Gulosibacter sp. TaxID=2817531 RepID=UPI003F93D433
MTAATDNPNHSDSAGDDAGADTADVLRASRRAFASAERSKRAADAALVHVLATSYDLATAKADIAPRTAAGEEYEQVRAQYLRAIVGEFAVEARMSDASLAHRANHAHTLMASYPSWVDALAAGRIEYAHTVALLRHDHLLNESQRAEYSDAVLAYAETHTSGQTRSFAERQAAKFARDDFEQAFEAAFADRNIGISHDPAGMSTIYATIPTQLAVPIDDLLTRQARLLRAEHQRDAAHHAQMARSIDPDLRAQGTAFVPDTRTIAQIRADLFTDTLLTATPQSILNGPNQGLARVKATVGITIPVLSLLPTAGASTASNTTTGNTTTGASNTSPVTVDAHTTGVPEAALVNGLHPMSTAQARQLAAEAPTLRRVLTHPITGHVISVDTYEPPASLRTFLRIRDRTCRFAGCTKAASASDLDHTITHQDGGPTSQQNLAHLCRVHHIQKHHRGWSVQQHPGGVLVWTSPSGQLVSVQPEPPGPIFRPVPEPPKSPDPPEPSEDGRGPANPADTGTTPDAAGADSAARGSDSANRGAGSGSTTAAGSVSVFVEPDEIDAEEPVLSPEVLAARWRRFNEATKHLRTSDYFNVTHHTWGISVSLRTPGVWPPDSGIKIPLTDPAEEPPPF